MSEVIRAENIICKHRVKVKMIFVAFSAIVSSWLMRRYEHVPGELLTGPLVQASLLQGACQRLHKLL